MVILVQQIRDDYRILKNMNREPVEIDPDAVT